MELYLMKNDYLGVESQDKNWIYEKDAKEILERRVKYSIDSINKFKKLKNIELSDSEFYELGRKYYSIKLLEEDYFDISKRILKSNNLKELTIKTSVPLAERKRNYFNSSNAFITSYSLCDAKIYCDKDFNIDTKHVYNVEELNNLSNKNKIVVRSLSSTKKVISTEEYKQALNKSNDYTKLFCLEWPSYGKNESEINYYSALTKKFREELTKDKIDEDIEFFQNQIKEELEKIKKTASKESKALSAKVNEYSKISNICEKSKKISL